MSAAPADRADRLAELVAEQELDALIVGDLVRPGDSAREPMANLSWLTGFAGTSGLALLGPEQRLFFTDFRYLERAERDLPDGFELVRIERQLVPEAATRARGRVGFDEAATSVKVLRALTEAVGEGVELVSAPGLVERLRRGKDEAEIEAIAEAARLTDEVFAAIEGRGLAGRSEREVALEAESLMRELGATGAAFPPIVAGAASGSLPHAEPSDRVIGPAELVVIDLGALLDGYCSDCTRTLASGAVGDVEREVYELVRAAQQESLELVRAGAGAVDVDAAARSRIERGGYAEEFGHGLGHGVGIEVHEAPRVSQRSEDTLQAGDVVTIEPGVYVPGRFGVRIEDLVVVTEDGHRNLSSRPKALRIAGA